ncbi:MAG TPA: hypothetical protein VE990_07810 [Acidimicrobiales bacterium]|nr:hypothetical protein [Acidimicrobiales bacterium]
MLVAWVVVVASVLLIDHVRSRHAPASGRRRRAPAVPPINAAAFIANWPPPRQGGRADVGGSAEPPTETRTTPLVVAGRAPAPSGALLQAAALGTFAAAATHAAVMPTHFRQSFIFGAFFLGTMIAQTILGCLLLARPSRRVLLTAVLGSAAVIVLWAFTRVVGVPFGPDHGATEPVGALDVLATLAEATTFVFGVLSLRSNGRLAPSWRWRDWAGLTRAASMCTLFTVVALTWTSPKG